MNHDDDPYATLGVARTASTAEIRAAFRHAVADLHPDRDATRPPDHEAITAVVDAWRLLADPTRRAALDAQHRPGAVGTLRPDPAPAARPSRPLLQPSMSRRSTARLRALVIAASALTMVLLTALAVIALSASP